MSSMFFASAFAGYDDMLLRRCYMKIYYAAIALLRPLIATSAMPARCFIYAIDDVFIISAMPRYASSLRQPHIAAFCLPLFTPSRRNTPRAIFLQPGFSEARHGCLFTNIAAPCLPIFRHIAKIYMAWLLRFRQR